MTQNEILGAIREVALSRAQGMDNRAANLQRLALVVSLAGMLITHPIANYLLALAIAFILVAWLVTLRYYLRYRHLGERARRVCILSDGLQAPLDSYEMRDMIEAASTSISELEQYRKPEYFDAKVAPGERRLAELVEESAFWSSRLYEYCAHQTKLLFGVALTVSIGLLAFSLPFLHTGVALDAFRVLFVLFPFLISGEVLVRAWGYEMAADEVRRVELLVRKFRPTYGQHDLLFLLGDYNSAVEMAPMMLKGAYEKNRDRLNKVWSDTHKNEDNGIQ